MTGELVGRYTAGDRDGTGGIRPDFVMVGVPLPDGSVELWASTELSYAELEALTRTVDVWDAPWDLMPAGIVPTSTSYTLRAGLSRFVIVRAPDYRAALEALITDPSWQPPGEGGGPLPIGPPG